MMDADFHVAARVPGGCVCGATRASPQGGWTTLDEVHSSDTTWVSALAR